MYQSSGDGRKYFSSMVLYPYSFQSERELLRNDLRYPGSFERMMTLDREYEKWRERYPENARQIMELVSEECDLYDYNGSFLYDEYPDPFLLKHLEEAVIEKAEKGNVSIQSDEKLVCEEGRPCRKNRNCWFCEMVRILLYQEIAKRRCRRSRWC